jgi:hypothetical protein
MSAAERVSGYLRKTATDGIIFGNGDKLTFYGTSDASHAVVQQEVANWHPALGVSERLPFSAFRRASHMALIHAQRPTSHTRQPSRSSTRWMKRPENLCTYRSC